MNLRSPILRHAIGKNNNIGVEASLSQPKKQNLQHLMVANIFEAAEAKKG
jgi:hypothetical protein